VSLKLNVGVSRKVGQPAFGSVGASCNLEIELEAGLIERDLDAFHARVRDAYIAAHQAVHDELDRLQAPVAQPAETPAPSPRHPSDGHTAGNGQTDREPASRSRPRRPVTDKQLRAIATIATRQRVDLGPLLREYGVGRPEDLSIRQASELIDSLNDVARN
jgi:hypothetical protein